MEIYAMETYKFLDPATLVESALCSAHLISFAGKIAQFQIPKNLPHEQST